MNKKILIEISIFRRFARFPSHISYEKWCSIDEIFQYIKRGPREIEFYNDGHQSFHQLPVMKLEFEITSQLCEVTVEQYEPLTPHFQQIETEVQFGKIYKVQKGNI